MKIFNETPISEIKREKEEKAKLEKENKEQKEKIVSLETQLTEAQLALTEIFEMVSGGE